MKNKPILLTSIIFLISFGLAHGALGQGIWSPASNDGFTTRYGQCSNAVGEGEADTMIYVFGGFDFYTDSTMYSGYLNTVEAFDPLKDTWSTPATTGTFSPRTSLTSSVVNGKIYVMGGQYGGTYLNTLEVFDPSTKTWSTPVTTGTFTPRMGLTSSVVNGKIYAIGGLSNTAIFVDTVGILEVFDPSTNTWSTPATTGKFYSRYGLCSSVVDGKIYVMGGLHGVTVYNTLDVFDPATNTWSQPVTNGQMTPRFYMSSSVLDGKIYVIGGSVGGSNVVNTVDVFDPSTNTWNTPSTSGIFTARAGLTSNVVGGNIYAMGGHDGEGFSLNTNEELSPASASSVASNLSSLDIQMGPNPTNGILTVHNGPAESHVSVMNMLGQTVLESANQSSADFTLDLSGLSPGTYCIRLVSPDASVTKMIVRE